MNHKTINKIAKVFKKNNIDIIHLQYVDILGIIRDEMMPSKEFLKGSLGFIGDGIQVDISNIPNLMKINKTPYLLERIDVNSFNKLPWTNNEGYFFCFLNNYGDSRKIAKKINDIFLDNKLTLKIGIQIIISLNIRNISSGDCISDEYGKFFYKNKNNYFLNKILEYSNIVGLEIEYMSVLNEYDILIDLAPETLLNTCDNIVSLKLLAKKIADDMKITASFATLDKNNFWKCHMSIWKNGKNLFFDKKCKNELSDMGSNFAGGIIKYFDHVQATIWSSTISHRLAINNIIDNKLSFWSTTKTNSVLFVPGYFVESKKIDRVGWSKRIVVNYIDGTANPYLYCSILSYLGLKGMLDKISIVKNTKYTKCMYDSIKKMENSQILSEVINECEKNIYCQTKLNEFMRFSKIANNEEMNFYETI